MKRLILALLLLASSVQAEVTCMQAGSFTFCSDGTTIGRTGNMIYDNHGNTWITNGHNTAYGSNGTVYQGDKDMVYDNKGNTWIRSGDTWFGSDGSVIMGDGR